MGLRGKTAPGEERVTHWLHDKVPGGSDRVGWLAGDVHIVECHTSKATRPCLAAVCGRNVRCPGCKRGHPPTPTGFVPAFRDDARPVFFIVYDHQFERVGSIKFGARIEWGRERGAGETVWVRAVAGGPRWQSTLPDRQGPCDLTRTLCAIWEMPELRSALAAYLGAPTAATTARSTPATIEEAIPGTPGWVRGVQDAASMAELGVPFEKVRESLVEKSKRLKPSTNGNGKH